MKSIAIIKYVFLLVGLAMLAGSVLLYQHTRSFLAHAARADGVVLDLVRSHSSSNSSDTWAPLVRFTPANGEPVEFTSSTSSNPPAYSKGEPVGVLYDPAQPQRAKIDGFFSLWGGLLILGVLGTIFGAIGGGILLYGRLARRREEQLLVNGQPVQADFQSVELNTSLTVNGRHPWRILAQWQDPATALVHVFHSQNLWYDPTRYVDRKQITVFIDGSNPKKYFVDLSFLPKAAD